MTATEPVQSTASPIDRAKFNVAACFKAAAALVASEPGASQRLLAAHQRSSDGYCTGCGNQRPVKWPCAPATIARMALAREPALIACGSDLWRYADVSPRTPQGAHAHCARCA
jgi:hypothetical protein